MNANLQQEPEQAFPYKPPTSEIKEQYAELFGIREPLDTPLPKSLFDKLVAALILVLCLPIIGLLFLLNFIEGIFVRENRGLLFFLL